MSPEHKPDEMEENSLPLKEEIPDESEIPDELEVLDEPQAPDESQVIKEDIVVAQPEDVEVSESEPSTDEEVPAEPEKYYPDAFAIDENVRHRAQAWELRKGNFAGFENLLLTLSSATLVFSLTFIKNVIDTKSPVHTEILKISWVFLVLTIFSILASYLWGIKSCERDIDIYEARFYYDDQTQTNNYAKRVMFTHLSAGTCFFIGLSLTILFSILNYTGKIEKPSDSLTADEKAFIRKLMVEKEKKTAMPDENFQKNITPNSDDAIKGGYGTKPSSLPPRPPAPPVNPPAAPQQPAKK